MKKTISALLLFFFSFSSFGNDGVYLTNGSLIYPTKETKILLNNEILSFKVIDGVAFVDIQFEFDNPENVDRKLQIGFQAPQSGGDVSDSIANLNHINNFRIFQNGKIIPYKLKASECEDCALKEPKDIHFSQFSTGIFVFLFEITFKPGLNQINHSYNFPASTNNAIDQFYNYILTTGSKWASGKIKNLTVHIDLGQNTYFYVNDIFGQAASWSIVGTGKVTNQKINHIEAGSCKMIRILSGSLQIKVTDFLPINNIEFGIVSKYSFKNYPNYQEDSEKKQMISIGDLALTGNYSQNELRIMRNTIYAQYSYDFNDPEMKNYFSQFEWYLPDPNLKMEDIKLTKAEQIFIGKIKKLENATEN